MQQKGFLSNLNLFFVLLFGIIGALAPFVSIAITHFGKKTDISVMNSTALMLLSVLIIVFLIIKAFSLFYGDHKKLFLLDLLFLILAIASLVLHLGAFLAL